MNQRFLSIPALLIVLLSSCSTSNKINHPVNGEIRQSIHGVSHTPNSDIPNPMANLTEKLGLDETKAKAVEGIISEFNKNHQAVQFSPFETRDLENTRDQKIKAILSPDQFTTYLDILFEKDKWPYLMQAESLNIDKERHDQYANIMAKYGRLLMDEMVNNMKTDKLTGSSSLSKARDSALQELLSKAEYNRYTKQFGPKN